MTPGAALIEMVLNGCRKILGVDYRSKRGGYTTFNQVAFIVNPILGRAHQLNNPGLAPLQDMAALSNLETGPGSDHFFAPCTGRDQRKALYIS
jgi:hypothetical protein